MIFLFKNYLTVLGILLIVNTIAVGTNYTWVGAHSTAWGYAGNWSPAVIPGSTDKVIIGTSCGSFMPKIDSNITIAAFTMKGCTLTIDSSYTITITGADSIVPLSTSNIPVITGKGTLAIGSSGSYVSVTIGSSTIAGTTISPDSVIIYSNGISYYNSIFNNLNLIVNVSSGSSSNGGNKFYGATSINNKGSGNLNLGNFNAGDIYYGNVTFSNNGTGALRPSVNYTTRYHGDITLNSTVTGTAGIYFGLSNGASTLDSGKAIISGTLSNGVISFNGFTQLGTARQNLSGSCSVTCSTGTKFQGPVTISTTGSGVITTFQGAVFYDSVTASSPTINLNGNTFNGITNITMTLSTSTGGNAFNDTVYITGNGLVKLNTVTGDTCRKLASYTIHNDDMYTGWGTGTVNTYYGDVIYTNYHVGSGGLTASYNGNSIYNGNIVVNSYNLGWVQLGFNGSSTLNSGGTISAGSFNTGTLQLQNFTQLGSTPQTITLTGSGILSIGNNPSIPGGNCTFNGRVIASAPVLQLGGAHYKRSATFTNTTGNSSIACPGGNIFDSTVIITSTAPSILFRLSNTHGDIFNSNVTIILDSSSSQLWINNLCSGVIGNTYNGNLTITNNSSSITAFLPSYNGTSVYNGTITINGAHPQQVIFGTSTVGVGGVSIFGGGTTNFASTGATTTFNGGIQINKTSGSSLNLGTAIQLNGAPLTLTSGNIVTTPTYLLTLNSSATVSGGSIRSFVNGPMAKIGNTAFTYPTGAGSIYAPIGISSITNNNTITAQYFNSSPLLSVTSNINSPLQDVSNCEYWTLKASASNSAKVTLLWDSSNCTLNNFNVYQVAADSATTGWKGLGAASLTGNCYIGSMITTNKTNIPISPLLKYFTYGFNSKLILNTKAVNPTTFTVSDGECFTSGTTFTSGTSGTGGGLITLHPSLSANAKIGIRSGTNNSADSLQIVMGTSSPSSVNGQFQGSYYPLSPSYYKISSDTVIFYKQQAVTPPLNITTNLVNGLVYNLGAGSFTVTVPGYSGHVGLNIYNNTGALKYTGSTNTWNGTINVGGSGTVSPGTYKFQVIVNSVHTYTGQLLYK